MNKEKQEAITLLKTSKGQIEGIIKMIEDERYCIDVSNQIIAAQALLKKANMTILKQHINHCVIEAINNGEGTKKIDEVMDIISKLMGK